MIAFQNLVKKFEDRVVLGGVTFEVAAGEIIFILGTSGTGKSVLLKCLVGLLASDGGEIWIDGKEVTRYTEDEFLQVRRHCGMVFQQPALFDSLTLYENVAFGLRRHFGLPEDQVRVAVERSLALVHVEKDILEKLPGQISYGMQKRVSLARTLALEPKILLFDEPTTGLDPVTTTTVNLLIQELSRTLRTTSLVVSHDMDCALAIADRIVVLDQGKVLAIGTPAEMRQSQVPLVVEFLAETRSKREASR